MNKNTNSSLDQNELTIFVNTSDSFEDCWDPFFKLFKTYWPNCPYPIVLNTEKKDYSYPGLYIRCLKVAKGEQRKLSWSECLMRALDTIGSKYILYLQEDYFLEGPVKLDAFDKVFEELKAGNSGVIYLSGGVGPWTGNHSDLIWDLDKNAKWRLSLQAGLWNKSLFASLLRPHETAWELESYGSYRTRRLADKFSCVNRVEYIGYDREIFPYQATGVIAGKWVKDIVLPLFSKHGIYVDLTLRGFHDSKKRSKKKRNFFLRLFTKVRSLK